jgi:subtilisin family serine protease
MSKIFIKSLFILFLTIQVIYSQRDSWGYVGDREIFMGVWNGDTIYYANSLSCLLNKGYSSDDVNDFIQSYGGTIRFDYFENANWGSIDLPLYNDALKLIEEWQSAGLFYSVEPVRLVTESSGVNDPKYLDGTQWYFNNYVQNPPGGTYDADVDMPEAWEITRGSPDILISVIDSGIPLDENTLELSHPDLNNSDRILLEYSELFVPADYFVRDGRGHGTHVTGIIAAETNNGEGIAGVAGNCKIMVCRVFNDQGNGTDDGIIAAIYWSSYFAEYGLRVINMSLVATESEALENAIAYTQQNNIVVVCAAGNHPGSNIQYPARYSLEYDNVIAVSATDHNDIFADSYSFGGLHINVAAPGGYGPRNTCPDVDDIFSTLPNYTYTLQTVCPNLQLNYDYLWGTSMSTPIVSGIAALILSVDPDLSASQVRDIIQSTADDKGTPGIEV